MPKEKPTPDEGSGAAQEPFVSLQTFLDGENPGEACVSVLKAVHRNEKHTRTGWRGLCHSSLSREVTQ